MKRLLDTNAYCDMRRGHPQVAELVRSASQIFFSTVVAGELLYGFRAGSQLERNRVGLESFLASAYVTTLSVTLETAERFGMISSQLRSKGTPIPTNDIWIAAHAMESGAELISSDNHFSVVDGLAWRNPGPG